MLVKECPATGRECGLTNCVGLGCYLRAPYYTLDFNWLSPGPERRSQQRRKGFVDRRVGSADRRAK
jgi:hypothetical protein